MTISPSTGPATRIAVRVPRPELALIDRLAEESGTSRSEVMRAGIRLLDPDRFAAAVAERLGGDRDATTASTG